MPGKDVADTSQPLTASGTANGVLTVASTAGFYASALATLAKTADGTSAQVVKVVAILSDTTLSVRKVQQRADHSASEAFETNHSLYQPNYGTSDMSAYDTTYTLYQPLQLIYNA